MASVPEACSSKNKSIPIITQVDRINLGLKNVVSLQLHNPEVIFPIPIFLPSTPSPFDSFGPLSMRLLDHFIQSQFFCGQPLRLSIFQILVFLLMHLSHHSQNFQNQYQLVVIIYVLLLLKILLTVKNCSCRLLVRMMSIITWTVRSSFRICAILYSVR